MANPTPLTPIPDDFGVGGAYYSPDGGAGTPTLPDIVREHHAAIERLQGTTTRVLAKVATTAQKALSGLAAIDGYTPVAGDVVLAWIQDAGAQNGLYLAAAGAWTRMLNADGSDVIVPNLEVEVERGTLYGDEVFHLTTNAPITVGTTALTFVREVDAARLASTAAGKGASLVGVADAGNKYTATDVEAALAEVKTIADAALPASKIQTGQLTLVAGTKTINAGIVITANSKVLVQLVTPGAGVSGSRYKVDTLVVGGAGVGAFTVTAVDSLAGDNLVNTDVSVLDYVILN